MILCSQDPFTQIWEEVFPQISIFAFFVSLPEKLKRIVSLTLYQADTSAVQEENKKLQDHCDAVQGKLAGAINKNKDLLADLEKYWEQEEELDHHLKETSTKVEENKPTVMDVGKLKEQLTNAQVYHESSILKRIFF